MRDGAESFATTVRRLLRTRHRAALGTVAVELGGAPWVSLAMVATAPDGSPLLFLSRLAVHTRDIEADPRVSLLFDGTEGLAVPLAGERATVCGRAVPCDDAALLDRYVRYHPDAADYRRLADFRLYRVAVSRAHLVAGFGRIGWVEAAELLLPEADWRELAAVEAEAVAHLNADHGDAVALYAVDLLGRAPGPWRVIGLDPEGVDLAKGHERARLDFPHRVGDARALRAVLADLAREGRRRRGSRRRTASEGPSGRD